MKSIKKSAIGILLMVSVVVLCQLGSIEAHADGTTTFHITGQYEQTSARAMLADINAFRTGSNAWYWNESNTDKVYVTGLSPLVYDYDLEATAMQRAMELSVYYDHKRPDGSRCYTAYSMYSSAGENIAAGYTSAQAVFEAWREDDDNNAGQGHRRNMLGSSFTAVGIGHVIRNGIHYWVQEFRSPVVSTVATPVENGSKTVDVVCTSSKIRYVVSPDTIDVDYGDLYDLSEVSEEVKYDGVSYERINPFIIQNQIGALTVEDTDVAEISNGELIAKKAGSTRITGTLSNGSAFSLAVTVEPRTIWFAYFDMDRYAYYTGSAITPEVIVTDLGKTLVKDTDYTVSYSNNVEPGYATVTVTGTGNYKGSRQFDFYIIDNSNDSNNGSSGESSSGNSGGTSGGNSGGSSGSSYDSEDDGYYYTQSGNKKKVKEPGMLSLKKSKKRFTASWEKVTGVSGYELQYSTDKKFKNAVTKNLKASKKSVTIKKLKAKKYYVRIRSYKTISGGKVYSKWSKTKVVKIK